MYALPTGTASGDMLAFIQNQLAAPKLPRAAECYCEPALRPCAPCCVMSCLGAFRERRRKQSTGFSSEV